MDHIFRKGWHAFCEKPFAISLAEYDNYLSTARENKVQTGVGFIRRYGPATLMAKQIVQGDYFGPILEVWANEGSKSKRTGQEADWYLSDNGSFSTSYLYYFDANIHSFMF